MDQADMLLSEMKQLIKNKIMKIKLLKSEVAKYRETNELLTKTIVELSNKIKYMEKEYRIK